ncbi:MAG: hypothetical protein M1831_000088 [Alyxoria varia]|nr:MAG: hypothetical protein M1831_000088 [Alyxoria varia]
MPPLANYLGINKITQILFDCDNTLVLSESLAFEACSDLANEILEKQGKPERYTGPSLLSEFVGYNFRGMLVGLQKKHNFSLPQDELDEYVEKELGAVVKKLNEKAEPCAGVMPVLEKYHEEKKYKLAIVSSSALSRVKASIAHTRMDHFFNPDHVFSAATSLEKPTSKPDPAIYLHACKVLGVQPGECVAIEDSRSGATAAKNAQIPLIGYVGPYYEEGGEEKVKSMEKVLKDECGALAIMHHWKEFDECMEKVIAA